MNENLITDLSPENVLSYSATCIEVCLELMALKEQNFKRLIIPSRGAYPFYNGAKAAHHLLAGSGIDEAKSDLPFTTWLLPFTSDFGDAKINLESRGIRKFWAKVLVDCLRGEKSPYRAFYEDLTATMGQHLTLNTYGLQLGNSLTAKAIKDEKFIFIDTVVSGQAICEIIEAFHDFNLKDFYIIAIVNDNAKGLKKKYRILMEKEKQQGRLKQINVRNIYSEDASPLLNSGISSIVFPSLIEHAIAEVPEFRNNNFAGAGLWFIDSVSHLRKYDQNLNYVRATVNQCTFRGIRHQLVEEYPWFTEQTRDDVSEIIKHLGTVNLKDGASTKTIVYDRIQSRDAKFQNTVDVSGSHVVRIDLEADLVSEILSRIKKK